MFNNEHKGSSFARYAEKGLKEVTLIVRKKSLFVCLKI